jgi:hypothetical protein
MRKTLGFGLAALLFAAYVSTTVEPTVVVRLVTTPVRVYPSWTPLPTATPRVYPTWTPARSATPVASRLPSSTPSRTPTFDGHLPPSATPTGFPCGVPWPFSARERQVILSAAQAALAEGADPDANPQRDALLCLGTEQEKLGAALSYEVTVLSETGIRIALRAFALGILAIPQTEAPSVCTPYGVILYSGEER